MDKLSKFLIDSYNPVPTPTAVKTAGFVEPSFLEKQAYLKASMGSSMDQDFMEKFEGTPLAAQAVALSEQELSMRSQQLQKRMQQQAQRKMDDTWEQDMLAEDAIALQKQQLLLQLYKMKAVTPAPQPGDAVIGEPQPQMQPPAPVAAPQPPGAEAGAPVPEPKVAAIQSYVQRMQKTAAIRAYARKTAGIAERGYGDSGGEGGASNASKALRAGVPAAFGAVAGAEGVPQNRLLGAAGGALGGVGGSELGGFGGRQAAKGLGLGPTGQGIGALIGHLVGMNSGIDLGTRGARLLAT